MEEQTGQNPAPSPESLERGYETTDVRFSGLWGFLIVSVIVMADDVGDQGRKTETNPPPGAARPQPTVGPAGANTINAGPPTTQTTTGTSLSPQGPGGTMERRATTRPAGREPK